MALTVDHHETVQARLRRDPEFRECLLQEALQCLLAGEGGVCGFLLRDYVIATVGFEQLGALTGRSPEGLAHLLGPEDAPSAADLLEVIACTLRHEGLAVRVSTDGETHDDGQAVAASAAAS